VNLLVAFALAQALPAPGAVRWEEIATESDGRTSIDPASVAREGDFARFLVRVDNSATRADGLRLLVMRVLIDCRQRRMGIETGDAYGVGDVFIESRQVPRGQIVFEPFGGTGAHAALYRRVCGQPTG
jgi:hypothetical protein